MRHPLATVALYDPHLNTANQKTLAARIKVETAGDMVNTCVVALATDPEGNMYCDGLAEFKVGHMERFASRLRAHFPDTLLDSALDKHKNDELARQETRRRQNNYAYVPESINFPDADATRVDKISFLVEHESEKMAKLVEVRRTMDSIVRPSAANDTDIPASKRLRPASTNFWANEENSGALPFMARVVKCLRSIPVGQTTVERVFSRVRRTYTPSRNRMKGSRLEKLVILQHYRRQKSDLNIRRNKMAVKRRQDALTADLERNELRDATDDDRTQDSMVYEDNFGW